MFLLLGAFLAGILTVLAPCVLPLLPIIIGGSVSGDLKDRRRPFIIAGSLAVSLLVFTLLLKATALLVNIPPRAITYLSGGIIIAIGLASLFPLTYATLMARSGLEHRAQRWLGSGTRNRSRVLGPIVTGAALGPVFSSCSPVYGYILATVLPAHFGTALGYIVAYVIGLALVLLAVGYYGQRFSRRLAFASQPDGLFQRSLAVIFILVGLLIITGTSTKIQTYAAAHSFLNFDGLSAKLLPSSGHTQNNQLYNVTAYPAPELVGLQHWINSQPETLASLRGKVVLIDFWTYSCINCIRSLPYVQDYYSTYQKDGLVVIGVHAPEFAFEMVPANVEAAVKADKLTYPIALDNQLQTWDAFHNQYWPAEYLIDRAGNVRRQHFGEGEYAQTEQAIRGLLKEGSSAQSSTLPAKLVTSGAPASPPIDSQQTPETYLGTARADAYSGQPELSNGTRQYSFSKQLSQNSWSLSGNWQVDDDKIIARGSSRIRLKFAAKNLYLVGGAPAASKIGLSLDGRSITNPGSDVKDSLATISTSQLYRLLAFPKFSTGTLELTCQTASN